MNAPVEMYQFCYNSYTSFGIHSSVIKKKEGGKKHLPPKNAPFVFTSYTSRVYWIPSPRFYDHVSCNFLTSIETSRELMRQSSSAPFMPATVSTRYSIW